MAKIINGFASAKLFSNEKADYLTSNGFMAAQGDGYTKGVYYFMNREHAIEVKGDTIEFRIYNAGEDEQRTPGYELFNKFEGVSALSIFDFMLLCQVMGFIKLKDFVQQVKKEIPQDDLFSAMGVICGGNFMEVH